MRRAGEPFPVHFRFTRWWHGRMAVVDAESTAHVRVPPSRLWEHRRWLVAGELAAIEEPDRPMGELRVPPLRGVEVAALIRFMVAGLRRWALSPRGATKPSEHSWRRVCKRLADSTLRPLRCTLNPPF